MKRPLLLALSLMLCLSALCSEGTWETWAPRKEIMPRCYRDTIRFRSAPDSLAISGDSNAAEYGGWIRQFTDIQPGKNYQFSAWYCSDGLTSENRQVVARIDWRKADGKRAGEPDYVFQVEATEGDWKKIVLNVPAPPNAAAAKLELLLGWAPQGAVWWDDISFKEATPPAPRIVRIGSLALRPRNTKSADESVAAFCEALDKIAADKPDIVCLGECITKIGTQLTMEQVAETIPGPSTEKLGAKAAQHKMYVVAGLIEREGNAIYNTAVLIGRDGKLAGKYRKVYLPREEVEAGVTPGTMYPVFNTDFGKVGMMVCYDGFFPDPARALAAKGAEIICFPVWGCDWDLMKARANENHVYLVSAGYDAKTAVIDPKGNVIHETNESGTFKVFPVDLNERCIKPWLGDMRARFFKEIRSDVR
ncbi:MAG TPA: carbon-nitrogen hydrolase family protein [Planctomycetota bacterium]|nr:carbon-nitrogen hydrolase family protein [Planctomycetota bacterium]